METVNVSVSTLETLIEGLESAIKVCYNVDSTDGNCERTYPYATGYSRSAMLSIQEQLKNLKTQAN